MQVCEVYRDYRSDVKDALEELAMQVRVTYRAPIQNPQSQFGGTQYHEEFKESHDEGSNKRRKLYLDKGKLPDRDIPDELSPREHISSADVTAAEIFVAMNISWLLDSGYVDVHRYENRGDSIFRRFSQQVLGGRQCRNGVNFESKAELETVSDNKLSAFVLLRRRHLLYLCDD